MFRDNFNVYYKKGTLTSDNFSVFCKERLNDAVKKQ